MRAGQRALAGLVSRAHDRERRREAIQRHFMQACDEAKSSTLLAWFELLEHLPKPTNLRRLVRVPARIFSDRLDLGHIYRVLPHQQLQQLLHLEVSQRCHGDKVMKSFDHSLDLRLDPSVRDKVDHRVHILLSVIIRHGHVSASRPEVDCNHLAKNFNVNAKRKIVANLADCLLLEDPFEAFTAVRVELNEVVERNGSPKEVKQGGAFEPNIDDLPV
mmetsp:Transcript_92559/g.264469  ORF Transcript_92559/g.264469 Transcript_92559/m.264469 type:complete len:217 (+) Transcript_92559:246-896(+)